jgi:hypothetical protein
MLANRVNRMGSHPTALSLPIVIASVRLVLGYRPYARSVFWFSIASLAPLFVACSFLWTVGSPDPLVDSLQLMHLHAILIVTLLSGIGLVRLCGFRLQRGAARAQAPSLTAPVGLASPQASTTQPPLARRFRALAGTLIALIFAMSLTAWRSEQRWQTRTQWTKLNLTIFFDGDRISSVHLTGMEPSKIQAAIDRLVDPNHALGIRRLYFSGATLTDEQLQSLATLKHLETLRLNNAKITTAGLAHLRNLHELAILDLGGTDIGDDAIEPLSTLYSLSFLTLDGTRVTEAGLTHLQALPNLRHVSLRNTSVSDDAANAFNARLAKR